MRKYINKILITAAALSVTACGGNVSSQDGTNGTNALVDIVPITADTTCTEGGYSINAGTDLNADGTLDADEITSTSTVCNGETGTTGTDGTTGSDGLDGAEALIEYTPIPVGDDDCQYGGTRVSVGVDNGDGDGVALDGILQAGEVDDATLLCEDGLEIQAKPVTPPEGPAGAFTINIEGGDGTVNAGGNGGEMYVEFSSGSLGGHIKIFNTGVADASFEMPATVSTYLGTEPLVIDSNTTIKAYDAGIHTGIQDGEVHLHQDDSAIYIYNETDDVDVAVTGLEVKAGVTLTFEPNWNTAQGVHVYLENDLHNAGTLTTVFDSGTLNRCDMNLYADTYYGAPGSLIDMSGGDADTGSNGGSAGQFGIEAKDNNNSLVENGGLIVSYSTVDTTGGDGNVGGAGGESSFSGYMAVYNAGDMDASGGYGSVARGGQAGNIKLSTEVGECHNSAQLKSDGGDGARQGGGGSEVSLKAYYSGDIYNTGELSANGGNADVDCATSCSGGNGGDIKLRIVGAGFRNNAPISARGGYGAAGQGGAGGDFKTENSEPYNGWYGNYQPLKDIVISGNIDLRGGTGSSGGKSGAINISMNNVGVTLQQEIIFLGYTDIHANGGDGETNGGNAGGIYIYHDQSYPDFGGNGPSGGNINYANLHASGGNGNTGTGGDGGYLDLETGNYYGAFTDGMVALNYGEMTLNGGNGGTDAGEGGWVYMWGYNRAENHGAIQANGGTYTRDNNGEPTSGGSIEIISNLGPAINTADIDVSGIVATGTNSDGGDAGTFEMVGSVAINEGIINTSGGNSAGTGGTGGDGEYIFIYGLEEGTTNTGSFILDGGTGDTVGAHGEVIIDGQNFTDTWVTL